MKKHIKIATAASLLSALSIPAHSDSLGIIVGEPTGLSYKHGLQNGNSIATAAAWSFGENESLQIHADYLFNTGKLNTPAELKGNSQWYLGAGARLKLKDDNDNGRNRDDDLLGVRLPLGINFYPLQAPVELFAEIVPVMDLIPHSDFDINAAIGARYIFSGK